MKDLFCSFMMAFSMFCAIPIPYHKWEDHLAKRIMPMFPIIGVILGGLWYFLSWVCQWLQLPPMLIAVLLTAYPFLVTGFMHLDGFMDSHDAILSRRPLEEKLRILKDSHTGAFAVISVGLLFLFNFSSTYTLVTKNGSFLGLFFIPILVRSLCGFGMLQIPLLSTSGYGAFYRIGVTKIHKIMPILFGILASAGYIILCEWRAIFVIFAIIIAYSFAVWRGWKELGGMSGDVSGYALTLAEAAGLFVMAIMESGVRAF